MNYFGLLLMTVVVTFLNFETSSACGNCHNTHHHYYDRGQRSVGVTTREQEMEHLEKFESFLLEHQSGIIAKMYPNEKEEYFSHLHTLDSTIRKLLMQLSVDNGDGENTFLSADEIMVKVIEKLHALYENEDWFKHIRKTGGNNLEELVQTYLNDMYN